MTELSYGDGIPAAEQFQSAPLQFSSIFDPDESSQWIPIKADDSKKLVDAGTLPSFRDWPNALGSSGFLRPSLQRPQSPLKWHAFKPEREQPGFFQQVGQEILKQAVSQILKAFGSEEFSDRDNAEKLAKNLPIKAVPLLAEGLKSDIPDVRLGADRAIKSIHGALLKKCVEPVEAINSGLTRMCNARPLTDEIRTKFEEKIRAADALNVSKEEFEAAANLIKVPEPGEPGFMDALNLKCNLQDAYEMRSTIRMWYATQLVTTGRPEDKDKAKALLIEATKLPGWDKAPGLLTTIVDGVGKPLEEWPKEIQEAYKSIK